MKLFLFTATAVLLIVAPGLGAEEKKKADPREKLETAIPHAISMLTKKKYLPFLKQFVPPDDLKKIQQRISLEDLAKSFGERKAELLLQMLRAVKDQKPVYNEKKNQATFKIDKKINRRDSITFKKVGTFWYIKN